MRSALRSPAFATLSAGYAVSAVGDGMSLVAISWLAIALAHGHATGVLVGASIAAYTLPGMLAGLVLGRLLTRWDGRALVLLEAMLRATCLGTVAVLAAVGLLAPVGFVVLLGTSSLFGLLGATGALTSVTELLPEEELVAGNAVLSVSGYAAAILGPVLAGLVVGLGSPALAIGADAVSYLVLILAVALSWRFTPARPQLGVQQSMSRSMRLLMHQPAVLGITLVSVVFFGLYGPVEVALPVYVSQTLHEGAGVLGGYWTAYAVGATAGAIAGTWAARWGLWRTVVVTMLGWGLCLVPFGFSRSVPLGLVALAVGGLLYGPFFAIKQTLIQRSSPQRLLPVLAAASGLLTIPAAPLGSVIGGPLVAAIGPAATLLASGVTTVVAGLVTAVILVRRGGCRPSDGRDGGQAERDLPVGSIPWRMDDGSAVSLDGRTFAAAGTQSGEVDEATRFAYHQHGLVIWADYAGGAIVHGHLVGTRSGNRLHFRYTHLNGDHQTAGGVCETRVEELPDGRLRLHETWSWESRPGSGTSVLEEVPARDR